LGRDVAFLPTLEATTLLDPLLAFSRVLRSIGRATSSVNLHLDRVPGCPGVGRCAAGWKVAEVIVVSLDEIRIGVKCVRDLNASHLLANVVREGATKLTDLSGFVEIGIGNDLAKVGKVGKKILLSLLQVVEAAPGCKFLVGVTIGGLEELDQLFNSGDVGVHERVNKRSRVGVKTRVRVDEARSCSGITIGVSLQLHLELGQEQGKVLLLAREHGRVWYAFRKLGTRGCRHGGRLSSRFASARSWVSGVRGGTSSHGRGGRFLLSSKAFFELLSKCGHLLLVNGLLVGDNRS
jgi:hypothetical protein